MDEFGKTTKEFCDENAAKASLIVAFLANAKLVKPSYNKSFTIVYVGLRFDKKTVKVAARIPDLDQFDADSQLIWSLFKKFGLRLEWRDWSQSRSRSIMRHYIQREMKEELVRRGGGRGFSQLAAQLRTLRISREPEKKREARKIQGDLNRALAAMRAARRSGATLRQLNKLARTVMAEEAVEHVHES